MKILHIAITTILIFFLGLQLNAQEDTQENSKKYTKRMFLSMGTTFSDYDDLNSSLSQFGYPELSENTFIVGCSGFKIIKKFVHGAEIHAIMGDRAEGNNYNVSLKGVSGKLNFGYMLFEPGNFDLFPHIGLGASSLVLNMDRDIGQASYDDFIQNPDDGAELYRAGFIADIGFNIHYSIDFMKKKERMGNMVFGFSVGYMFDPFKRDWIVNGEQLANGPDLNHNNLYLKIIVGKGKEKAFPMHKRSF
ncbi:MAG: hypothetical protein ACLFVR_09340 [Thiohalospira sp.]